MELHEINQKTREILAKKFIEEVILPQWKQLGTWNSVTNQTSQLDFGYLSQHLVSLVSGLPGNNQRGKGDDLKDGSEVKSASCLDAEDTPRWNGVNCGARTLDDIDKKYKGLPYIFFVLLDTTERKGDVLRCRIWVVRPGEDEAFRAVALGWAKDNDERVKKGESQRTNLQLHPPRWEQGDENITTNTFGNLKLPLMYECVQLDIPDILVMESKVFKPAQLKNGNTEAIPR